MTLRFWKKFRSPREAYLSMSDYNKPTMPKTRLVMAGGYWFCVADPRPEKRGSLDQFLSASEWADFHNTLKDYLDA